MNTLNSAAIPIVLKEFWYLDFSNLLQRKWFALWGIYEALGAIENSQFYPIRYYLTINKGEWREYVEFADGTSIELSFILMRRVGNNSFVMEGPCEGDWFFMKIKNIITIQLRFDNTLFIDGKRTPLNYSNQPKTLFTGFGPISSIPTPGIMVGTKSKIGAACCIACWLAHEAATDASWGVINWHKADWTCCFYLGFRYCGFK